MPEMFNWSAVGAITIPIIGGFTSTCIVACYYPYYEKLHRPWWAPPKWVRGPAWFAAYSSIGYASYLVYRDGGGMQGAANRLPLLFYGSSLILTWCLPPSFVMSKRFKLPYWEITFATLTATGTGFLFYRINQTAGLIFVSYVFWLGLLTAASYKIYLS